LERLIMTNTLSTEEQIVEAIDWTSDCLGMGRGVKVGAERAAAYVRANYPGGWDAFVTECCTYVTLDKRTETPESGYTPCACRDCMDTTVSSDASKPELCSECRDAGCTAIAPYNEGVQFCTTYECQRDDAYGEC
jgi:hypothetical protein